MSNTPKEIEKINKKIEMIDVEIESLIISLDVNHEIVEALDKVGVVLYKLYNKIKAIIE